MKKIIWIIPIFIIGNIYMLKAQNTSYGTNALSHNTSGNYNGAFGANSLYNNTAGSYNSAFGTNSMYTNTTGNYNTALGVYSMFSNTNGLHNTASGYYSLYLNTTGSYNIAFGNYSLYNNTNGNYNSATGFYSMYYNSSGSSNTAHGYFALFKNTTGNYNTALGYSSLNANTTGSNNTAIGDYALYNNTTETANTAIGVAANQSVGYTNTTAIGYASSITASNQVRIGNSSVTSIGGQVSWTTLSDGRFKKEIKHDVPGLDFINKLEPVSYVIDKEAFDKFLKIPDSLRIKNNNAPITHSGFIAQDVEKILKEMNISNFSGVDIPKNENDYYGIRYDEFVVPLVKAVQELSAKIKEQDVEKQLQDEKINKLEKIITDAGLVSDLNSSIYLESEMNQNNPNPFATSTEIKCFVPSDAQSAILMVFDMNGKLIKTITITERKECLIKLNASELNGLGMYMYSLYVNNKEICTRRMILSK